MTSIDTIGERAYSECLRIFGTIYKAAKKLGVSHPMIIYRWGRGESCPQAHFLAQLCIHGADIEYILTGGSRHELS